jgi:hypothetical protein
MRMFHRIAAWIAHEFVRVNQQHFLDAADDWQ